MDDEQDPEAPLDSVERQLKGLLDEGFAQPPPPTSLVGETIADTYTVLSSIGQGGMGAVWLARHERTGGEVALKVIRADRLSSPNAAKRFELEAKHTASLKHPNIVRVFDYGRHEGLFYLAMEHVPGVSLQDLMEERGKLAPTLCVTIASQVLRALDGAHADKIIHRDIKPANILVTNVDSDPFVKVVDFGIARALDGPGATTQGVIGSPSTMAPEQFEGGDIVPATDLYALGCTIYGMLSGDPPFTGSVSQLAYQHVHEDPTPLATLVHGDAEAAQLAVWVDWLMEKSVGDRPATAMEALDALIQPGVAPPKRIHTGRSRIARIALLMLVALTVGALAVAWSTSRDSAPPVVGTPATTGQLSMVHEPLNIPNQGVPGPDGKRFAYIKDRLIEILRVEDNEVSTVPLPPDTSATQVSWYPDGEHLLVSESVGLEVRIAKLGLDGSHTVVLEGVSQGHVAPDGTRIAFARGASYTERPPLVVADIDGGNPRTIVQSVMFVAGWLSDSSAVTYFMDGDNLGVRVANSERDVPIYKGVELIAEGGHINIQPLPDRRVLVALASANRQESNLWAIELDDQLQPSEPEPLTDTSGFFYADVATGMLTSDIIYCRARAQLDMVRANLIDSRLVDTKDISATSRSERVSDLSDDGARILFSAKHGDHWQIYEQSLDGTNLRQVTDDDRDATIAIYVPGTTSMLYWASSATSSQLMLRTADGESRPMGDREFPRHGHLSTMDPSSVDVQCIEVGGRPRCVLHERLKLDRRFSEVDLETGEFAELFVRPVDAEWDGIRRWSLRAESPEIVMGDRGLTFLTLDGELAGTVEPDEPVMVVADVTWAPDGGVIASTVSRGEEFQRISRILEDGRVEHLGATTPRQEGIQMTPDASQVVWSELRRECSTWKLTTP